MFQKTFLDNKFLDDTVFSNVIRSFSEVNGTESTECE